MVDINILIVLYAIQGQKLGGYFTPAYRVCEAVAYLLQLQLSYEIETADNAKNQKDKVALSNMVKGDLERLNRKPGVTSSLYSEKQYKQLAHGFLHNYVPYLRDLNYSMLMELINSSIDLGTPGLLKFLGGLGPREMQIITLSQQLSDIRKTDLWEYYNWLHNSQKS